MVRRFIVMGLATALAAPAFSVTPASAAILFTCPAIASGSGTNFFVLTPGLSHTQTAQTVGDVYIPILTPCSNGETSTIYMGPGFGLSSLTSYSPRPLGCPRVWVGAGPDYPDQTPILLGATDPSFQINWDSTATTSTGIAKVKQGPYGDQWRLVLNITAGKYAPPAGMKTKMKFTAEIHPYPGYSATCFDDSYVIPFLELVSVGSIIVNRN